MLARTFTRSTLAGICGFLAFAPTALADGAQVVKVPFRVNAQAKADIAACVGENVTFTDGEFNIVTHLTPTLFTFHRNVVGGVGVGQTTGATYHATGHLQSTDVLPQSGGESFTFELTLNVVGTGNSGHFTAHAVEHLTFTPAGDLVSDVEIDGIR